MYTAKLEKQIDSWNSIVGVYKGDEKVGEYARNYYSFGAETFAAFERDGNWYALYSENYTAISIAKLPSMEKIGGEIPDSFGFCPVEIFIPVYSKHVLKGLTEEELEARKIPIENRERARKDIPYSVYYTPEELKAQKTQPERVFHADFAMVAGCVWGDDSSWKFQLRDISKAHEGIISDIPFEYTELHHACSLQDIIINEDDGNIDFRVPTIKYLRMTNGKVSEIC